MHASSAPMYQIAMISLAIIVLVSLLILFWKRKPDNIFEKTLALFCIIFSLFFFLLPNHEYYLLPLFVPLFLYLGIVFNNTNKTKKILRGLSKKVVYLFLIISVVFLIIRPVIEVDWEQPSMYVKNYYPDDITIYCSNPKVAEYYIGRETFWLTSDANITESNTIVMFTIYDRANLEGINLMYIIQNELVLLKDFNGKIFVYASKDVAGEV
jgi:hypothetical protein